MKPTPEQRTAADPGHSVWVDANAGTGKTRVLTDRVLRLLLAGAPPGSILCLTYTRAAAGEMLARVGDRLARWATVDEASLEAELAALDDRPPSPARQRRARGLHDAVLALPAGLAIMTVHSLGQHLLRRFPLEAGVPASFEIIDDRTRAELLNEARDAVLARALDEAELEADLARLAGHAADRTILDAVDALVGHRLDWVAARETAGGVTEVVRRAASLLDVSMDADAAAELAAVTAEAAFDRSGLAMAAQHLEAATQKTRREAGAAIARWLAADPTVRIAMLESYRGALATFAKDDRPPRWRPKSHLNVAKLEDEAPAVAAALVAEVARLDAHATQQRARRQWQRTAALLRVADRVLETFEAMKAQRAVLDFDDLLLRTRALLAAPGAGDWVRFKLDQAFTHILVDEAQDTNPLQWSLIVLLLEEVFGGEGTRGLGERTFFVVGDAKQSIYRFQGADPEAGARIRADIERRAKAAGLPLRSTALTTSFRSSQAVLDVVDALLADAEVSAHLGTSPPHRAFQTTRGGRVELWPLVDQPPTLEGGDPWAAPPRSELPERAERRLAEAIAAEARRWFAEGLLLPGSGRAVRPSDVMILLRRREPMQGALVRAFKQAGVAVAGADRLLLTGHLAVQDLVALGEAVLLPEYDFALACVMKSPLVGLDEDDLFALAHARAAGESLHARWRRCAEDDPTLAALFARFAAWQRLADFVPPYEFYLRVLGGEVEGFSARLAFERRFGPEVIEPLDAFVEQALAFEQGHPATLQGFLDWLQQGEPTLKREGEAEASGVRIMTVHGAKGLEAPVVVLADAGPRAGANRSPLLWHEDPPLPFWRPAASDMVAATAQAADAEARALAGDDLRLLYVAATRAAEWLIVTGCRPRKELKGTSWHDRLATALDRCGGVVAPAPPGFEGGGVVYAKGVPASTPEAVAEVSPSSPPPAWLRTRAPQARRAVLVRPSAAVAPVAATDGVSGRGEALRVGNHVHHLLERLPVLAPAERMTALDAYLEAASDIDGDLAARVRAHVRRILEAPSLAPLFAAEALAEQPIVGEVRGVRIAGQVDRMAVVGDELWIADFKTGQAPAAGLPVPAGYARQLALYAAVLEPLFAGRRVRAFVVWTERGEAQEVDRATLEAHMPLSAD